MNDWRKGIFEVNWIWITVLIRESIIESLQYFIMILKIWNLLFLKNLKYVWSTIFSIESIFEINRCIDLRIWLIVIFNSILEIFSHFDNWRRRNCPDVIRVKQHFCLLENVSFGHIQFFSKFIIFLFCQIRRNKVGDHWLIQKIACPSFLNF